MRGDSDAKVRLLRLVAIAIATVFVLCAFTEFHFAFTGTIAPDFVSYWAAGRMMFEGHPTLAYDIAAHRSVEQRIFPTVGYLPFVYPPSFLLVLLPFGMAPFSIAFAGWIAITAVLYIASARRLIETRFALSQAAAAANFIVGQNGFLTSAIFIRGTTLLQSRPLVGGAILGLLSLKPQLALLLPVALLAGREWRAIAGGILCSLLLAALALLVMGTGPYQGFLSMIGHFSDWLSAGRWRWGEIASVYAALRFFGVQQSLALGIHVSVAIFVAVVTGHAWASRSDRRIPILAAATLLASPYVFTYDALLLVMPMAYLREQGENRAFGLIWVLSLMPVIGYFRPFPNTIPLAAMLCLWALHRRSRPLSEAKDGEGSQLLYQV